MTNSAVGGKSNALRINVDLRSWVEHRFFIPDTNYNADLADHGNSADKTPVTLWGAWSGQNQVWRLQDA